MESFVEDLKRRAHFPISVDSVIFGYSEGRLKVALIRRKKEPFVGMWAIPGGFMEGDETVEETALRELEEETGIKEVYIQECGVFSKRGRDPRGPTITVAFFSLIDAARSKLAATEDASEAKWWPAYETPHLAFDHDEIYEKALLSLRESFQSKPLAFELLPKEFTLTQLQQLYAQVFGRSIDKRNFRKKVLKWAYVVPTGTQTSGGRQRPALLYTFDADRYKEQSDY